MINNGLYSSASAEWETPQALYDALDRVYGPFTLDAAATQANAKCSRFFSKEDDSLQQVWTGRVFLNPPYGRAISRWVAKAYESAQTTADVVVCLLPARTDTAWFHDYCSKGEITFLRGRLRFSGSKNSAPFPSMIVTFRRTQ